jgi:glycosyltransferase involved in cell wall biosynthesis
MVSVVIASKNGRAFLGQTLESIHRQTFFGDIEVVLVDDGSDIPYDYTEELLAPYNNIRVFRTDGIGQGAALNLGIQHSLYDVICRIDDDDLMTKDRINEQFEILQKNSSCSVVYTPLNFMYNGRYVNAKTRYVDVNSSLVEWSSSYRFPIAHSSLMFRKSDFFQIGGYRYFNIAQDLDLILGLMSLGQALPTISSRTFYRLRMSGASLKSAKLRYSIYNETLVYRGILACSPSLSDLDLRRKVYWNKAKRIVLVLKIISIGKKISEKNS